MVDNNKKIERLSFMKEKIQREVFLLFQSCKDDLEVSRRMYDLLQRDIPAILDEFGVRGMEYDVQDILHDSLRDVYRLDNTMDEKSLIFSDTLSRAVNSREDQFAHSQDEEELNYQLSGIRNRVVGEYSERSQDIDKDNMRNENDLSTYEPDFKRDVRSYLMSHGIENEEMLSFIERRVKSVVGDIYDDYHRVDRNINDKIEEICDEEIGEFKSDVLIKYTETQEQPETGDSFRDSLKNGTNSYEEIAQNEVSGSNTQQREEKEEPVDPKSLRINSIL